MSKNEFVEASEIFDKVYKVFYFKMKNNLITKKNEIIYLKNQSGYRNTNQEELTQKTTQYH